MCILNVFIRFIAEEFIIVFKNFKWNFTMINMCYVRWLKLTLIEEVSFRHKQNIYICLCDI